MATLNVVHASQPSSLLDVEGASTLTGNKIGSARARHAPPSPPLSDSEVASPLRDALEEIVTNSNAEEIVYSRRLGDTELSYYLPARADGVNDMYLHIGFTAPSLFIPYERVLTVWSILRLRNPPLASRVRSPTLRHGVPAKSDDAYKDVNFVYNPPLKFDDVTRDAESSFEWREESREDLIHNYLNGPRTLSDDRLTYLVLATQPIQSDLSSHFPTPAASPALPDSESFSVASKTTQDPHPETREYDLLMAATHFVGDGMALHRFMNEFFSLLFSASFTSDLKVQLYDEWSAIWAKDSLPNEILPVNLESYLPLEGGRFRRAAAQVDFQRSQKQVIGGHIFPRPSANLPSSLAPKNSPLHRERRTIVPTTALNEADTKKALKRCKEKGVSVANALFALSAIAWAKVVFESGASEEAKEKARQPILMYSALNLRPNLLPKSLERSYWFTAVGYFNIILPGFLPSDATDSYTVDKVLWLRARSAKSQSSNAAKSKLLVPRTHAMARVRGERARRWAREDDEKDAGIVRPKPATKPTNPTKVDQKEQETKPWVLPPAPSAALLGLSLLGNLDGVYAHTVYSSHSDAHKAIKLHTLTTGSRQRPGALLLFGYTFAGKLWVSLGYDVEGFAKMGEAGGKFGRATVDGWLDELRKEVHEHLVV